MRELPKRNLDRKVYLWSDDNLSNDYFWRYLSPEDIKTVKTFRNYGKVCCFKGYDAASFAFNTAAEPELFERQLQLFGRYLSLGIDLYAYATFTSPSDRDVASKMSVFVDRLQEITPNLPLRVVPLEIREFAPVTRRDYQGTQGCVPRRVGGRRVRRSLRGVLPSSHSDGAPHEVSV